MKVKFFLFLLLFLVVLYGSNPANMCDLKVQAQMEKKNWHEEAFFGMHYDIHHRANDTEVGVGCTEEHIRRELEKVKPDFVQYEGKSGSGYTSYPTKIGTPAPGLVKDALKIWRKVTKDMGIRLSVYWTGPRDPQAIKEHPEWVVLNPDGTPYLRDGRSQYLCHNSDYVEKYMIPQMIEVIDEYDIDGFWVDGDYHATNLCWCDRCKSLFAQRTGVKDIPEKEGDPYWVKWLEFHRQSFIDYVKKYCDAVHARKPGCLVCSNWNYSFRVPDEITAPVDYLSGDFVGIELDVTELDARFYDSRQITWDLMPWLHKWGGEIRPIKPLPQLLQESVLVLANGGNLFVYSKPQRNGHLVGWHQDLLAEMAKFARQRQAICQHSKSVPQVALLHSKHHYYSTNNLPLFRTNMQRPLEGALMALLENHYHVDVLNEETLTRRMNEYNLIVVAEQTNLPLSIIEKLEEYVYNGGRLLVTGDFAAKDFGKILGVERIGDPKEGRYYLPADGGVIQFRGPVQFVRPTTAKSLVFLYSGQEVKTDVLDVPIATAATYGKGLVGAIHAPVFEFFNRNRYSRFRSFFGDILNAVAPKQLVELDAPPCVDMTIRKKENKFIVHLLNRSSDHPFNNSAFVEGVPVVGPLHLRIEWPKRPAQVRLAPDSDGLRWDWKDGTINVKIASLHIHNAVVIE